MVSRTGHWEENRNLVRAALKFITLSLSKNKL